MRLYLLMERNKKAHWSEQEIKLLRVLYPQLGSKKWKKIAQEMRRQGFQRSEIEIRERWVNFEDPCVNKTRWEEEELARLYDIHDQVGTKWCVIQKYIGRTQNMIKNRFYGTLRNYIRFLLAHFSPRGESYNRRISTLSPKILNDIYKAEHQFKFLGEEVKEAIYGMRFKIDKRILAERFKEKQQLYERLKGIVCRIFSEISSSPQEKQPGRRKRKDEDDEWKIKEEQQGEEQRAEEQEDGQEEEGEKSSAANSQGVKAESVEEVYPFLKRDASELKFKVQDEVFYPFMGHGSFAGFEGIYLPLTAPSLH